MTDKELLEAAAKAVGMSLDFKVRGDFPPYYLNKRGGHSSWNPLADDGDALRLAVVRDIEVWNTATDSCALDFYTGYKAIEPHNSDKFAATRRAIVRAAAGGGK